VAPVVCIFSEAWYNPPTRNAAQAMAGAAAEEGRRSMGKGKAQHHREESNALFCTGLEAESPDSRGGFCPGPGLVQRGAFLL